MDLNLRTNYLVHCWALSLMVGVLTLSLKPETCLGQTNVTVDATAKRLTGGVGTLDREQYFNFTETIVPPTNTNLGNLLLETWSPDGLNLATGRISTELDSYIASNVTEDPSKPGFFDHTSLTNRLQGAYKNFVENGSRWETLRQHDNPIVIQSGRNGGFWPNFLDGGTDIPTNYEAFADFMNVYYEEVIYGPNAFMPVAADRFHFEVMNEPVYNGVPWAEVIDLHRVVTEQIKEVHPEASIGGPSCCDELDPGGFNDYAKAKLLIDDMTTWQTPSGESVQLDFFTFHPYERYDVQNDGSHVRRVDSSPGRLDGSMDLLETYSAEKLGAPLNFSITEYGSFNRTNLPNDDYGNYARDEQQWDLVRDVKEKMLVLMNRPDRIINATPFVAPKHFSNQVPTPAFADRVFFEQDATGTWSETIVGNLFRMLAPVSGEYVGVDVDNPDLQSTAFRNGNTLYVLLNNLQGTTQGVDLAALAGLGNVSSASWSRVYRSGGSNSFVEDADVTSDWQNLSLEGEAGAVLTLQLDGPDIYDHAYDSRTFYGDQTELDIVSQQFISMNIDAEIEDAVAAKLRVGYGQFGNTLPTFSVRVNGNSFSVTSAGLAKDDGDLQLVTREIDVPVEFLNEGANDITFFFPFSGTSGTISSAVLEIAKSIGDYDGSGVLSGGDIDQLYQQFGAVTSGDKHDLTGDDQVDAADVDQWLALRNTVRGDTDVDGDIDTRDAVALFANLQSGAGIVDWTKGNFDGDDDADQDDIATLIGAFTGAGSSTSTGSLDLSAAAENPDLVYDPATGEVSLSADDQLVFALHLSTEQMFLTDADFSALDADVGSASALIDNTDTEIGWVSADAASFGGYDLNDLASLGMLLPTGLDAAGLAAFFADASWGGFGEGGLLDLVVLSAGLTGDFNEDGIVDAADYTIWRDTLGSTTDLRADANGDSTIDSVDYALWRTNFGAISGSGSSIDTVPEAASGFLLAAISLLAVGRKLKRP